MKRKETWKKPSLNSLLVTAATTAAVVPSSQQRKAAAPPLERHTACIQAVYKGMQPVYIPSGAAA